MSHQGSWGQCPLMVTHLTGQWSLNPPTKSLWSPVHCLVKPRFDQVRPLPKTPPWHFTTIKKGKNQNKQNPTGIHPILLPDTPTPHFLSLKGQF